MENKDKPTFAHNDPILQDRIGRGISEQEYNSQVKCLTKREYFAGLAMQAIFIKWEAMDNVECAKRSVRMADEILKQLENGTE